jgi:tetratricopeptide (TPR) repeat protein
MKRAFAVLIFAGLAWGADTCPPSDHSQTSAQQFARYASEAQQAFQANDYAKAATTFRTALCFAPDNGSLYYGLGLAEAAASHFDRARDALIHARRLSPGDPAIALSLAQVNASQGDFDGAISNLARFDHLATQHQDEEQKRTAIQLRAQLGQALLGQSRFDLALAQFLRVKQAGVSEPAILLMLATLENNLGAYADAERDADAASAGDVTREQGSTAAAIAGLAYKNEKKKEEAIRSFRASIELAPSEIACLALTEVFETSAEAAKAIEVSQSCSAAMPESAPIAIALGRNLVNAGKHEQAVTVLERVTQNAPDQAEAWRWLAQAETLLGDYPKAVAALQQLARAAPAYPMVDSMLAQAMLKADPPDYQQAIQHLDRAARTSPSDSDVFFMLGKTYFSMGRYAESAENLRKAIQLGSNSSLVYYQLGRALEKMGRESEARQQFETVRLLKSIGQ